jgi:pimeloyl-ACP methyl ester carboxylesterase
MNGGAILAVLVVVMPLLATGVAAPAESADEAAVPRFEAAACPFPMPTDLPAGETLRCGYLVVPEQRSDSVVANSDTVRLAVAMLSSGHPRAAEPVVYLAGGPGEAGSTDLLLLLGGSLQTLVEDRDWIFLDQRGTGFSEPALTCPEVQINGVSVGNPGQIQHTQDCAARLTEAGVDLSAYTTQASAADVVDLVHALGYEQVNLYGASYGTRVALTVERDSPELVRSVILDAVSPPQTSLYADGPISFSRSLRSVFDACAADSACHAKYSNPLGQLGHLLGRLHAQPVGLDYTDPATHQQRHVMLDSKMFVQIVYVLLYVREGLEMVPALIGITDGGDYGPVASFLPDLNAYGGGVSIGMYYSVECAEVGPHVQTTTLPLQAELPGIRADLGLVEDLMIACSAWPVPPADAGASEPVVSEVPTLLFAGHFDPITPPEYMREAATTLAHSHIVEFATGSHVTLSSGPCSIDIAREFLAMPDQPPDPRCAAEGTLDFVLP